MRPPGTFKLSGRTRRTGYAASGLVASRGDRIVDSLRSQILEQKDDRDLRIRQVFEEPKAVYRIELERPEYRYQRTTLLDRDALEDLLATDDVRERFIASASAQRTREAVERAVAVVGREERVVPGAGLEPARPEARRF